jgi:RNA polymerase sigma-70 factor (ECF subfamily)
MTFWHSAYRDHGPAVLGYLSSRMRREDAEDLLQETFVRAIRSSGSLRDQEKLRPYLLTIAHNLWVNRYRRREPQLFSELVPTTAEDGEPAGLPEPAAPVRNAEQEADLARLEERLGDVVADMSPHLRAAFEQGVLRQEPYRDIARRNGWSMAQVKINVYRARQRAITKLRDLMPGAEAR